MISKTHIRAVLYSLATACSFALANLKAEMFGTGEVDWPHFRFEWFVFAIGLISSIVVVLRAFVDDTAGKSQLGTSSSEPPKLVPAKIEGVIQPAESNL